jgi:hypothetical protein
MNNLNQISPEERPSNKDADDEISLIDLFVVLLKYRRLIMIFVILGIVVSAGFYLIQRENAGRTTPAPELTGEYEGRMAVVINPRMGGSGTDKLPGWFNSRELFNAALKESGLEERTFDSFTITYNAQMGSMDIVLKPGPGDQEHAERFFSLLLKKAESLASAYYTQYAVDLISWFESLRDSGKDYSAQDYVQYCWARDLLSGRDTVLKALYPPFVSGNTSSKAGASPRVVSLVIVFAFLFLAIFLAFVLNALKNISADNEAMTKIRGALAKEKRDNS